MDAVSDAKKFAQPALDPDSVLTFLRLCLGRFLLGKLKSEVAFQQCVPLLPFFFFFSNALDSFEHFARTVHRPIVH